MISSTSRIFRSGWMVLSGDLASAGDYIQGLNILANMRLCSNVPGQFAIQTALGGYQSIDDLVAPGGRLREQRDACYQLLADIPGISCVKPQAALYCFPKIDTKKFNIKSDERLVLDYLLLARNLWCFLRYDLRLLEKILEPNPMRGF